VAGSSLPLSPPPASLAVLSGPEPESVGEEGVVDEHAPTRASASVEYVIWKYA
jgi:hypothetical protein